MSDSQLFDFGTGSRLTRVMSLAKKASNKLFMRDSDASYQVHCALGGGAAGRYGNGKSRFWTASAAGMTDRGILHGVIEHKRADLCDRVWIWD